MYFCSCSQTIPKNESAKSIFKSNYDIFMTNWGAEEQNYTFRLFSVAVIFFFLNYILINIFVLFMVMLCVSPGLYRITAEPWQRKFESH